MGLGARCATTHLTMSMLKSPATALDLGCLTCAHCRVANRLIVKFKFAVTSNRIQSSDKQRLTFYCVQFCN